MAAQTLDQARDARRTAIGTLPAAVQTEAGLLARYAAWATPVYLQTLLAALRAANFDITAMAQRDKWGDGNFATVTIDDAALGAAQRYGWGTTQMGAARPWDTLRLAERLAVAPLSTYRLHPLECLFDYLGTLFAWRRAEWGTFNGNAALRAAHDAKIRETIAQIRIALRRAAEEISVRPVVGNQVTPGEVAAPARNALGTTW